MPTSAGAYLIIAEYSGDTQLHWSAASTPPSLTLQQFPQTNASSSPSSAGGGPYHRYHDGSSPSTGGGAAADNPLHSLGASVAIAIVLVAITLACLVGNLLVMVAVCLVRRLRTPSNYLIANLAVADWLVGLLVMPWAIAYDVLGHWPFGASLCYAWITCDVLLSTASILNLMMISVDRYLIITRPLHYAPRRGGALMLAYMVAAWSVSVVIGLTPLVVGWKHETRDGICLVSQELGYQIYATIGAFYLPLAVMLTLYGKVLYVSTSIALSDSKKHHPGICAVATVAASSSASTSASSRSGSGSGGDDYTKAQSPSPPFLAKELDADCARGVAAAAAAAAAAALSNNNKHDPLRPWEDGGSANRGLSRRQPTNVLPPPSRLQRRQRLITKGRFQGAAGAAAPSKAVTTLGVIMGGFVLFWLPFFIVALIRPFCKDACDIPIWVQSLLTWLGYVNSCLNPIVYIRFNREYRTPFKEILLMRCRTLKAEVRREEYRHQYGTLKRSKPVAWV